MKNNKTLKRKLTAGILIMFLLIPIFSISVAAADVLWESNEIPSTRQKPRFYDAAELLSESEEEDINERLDYLSEKWKCNVALLTVYDYSGSAYEYADSYFDYNGFRADYNGSGIILMIGTSDRSWTLSTSGAAIQAFTDYGQEYIADSMTENLSDDDYYYAFIDYVNACDFLLDLYSKGTPYDRGYKAPRTSADVVKYILLSLVIGFVLGLIPIMRMKEDLRTVKPVTGAAGYQSAQGIQLSVKEDRFIRKTLSKIPIPKTPPPGAGRGGGGGSSIHTSGSGMTHGGSHGHF